MEKILKVKKTESNQAENPNAEELEVIKSLLNYPSLEKVFDQKDAQNPSAIKRKMQSTIDDLERVIRRGTKADAEKAARTIEACKVVLNFLNELENARRAQAK